MAAQASRAQNGGVKATLPIFVGLLAGLSAALPPGEQAPEPAQVSWSIYRGTPALDGIAAGKLPDRPELLWTFEAGGAITSSPVVANGIVYFGSDDQHVRAVDISSGEERWSFPTEDIIEAPPLVIDGMVFTGSSDFSLYALDADTGELRWRFETNDKLLGSANWTKGPKGETRILIGSYDTYLYCIDAVSGDEVWRYKTDNYVNGTPAVLGERVVFGGCDAGMHVVSTITGKRLSMVDLGEESYIAGSVGLADGRAYFGHYGNAFVCIDLEAEAVVWSFPGDRAFFSSPAITADRVVFGGRDKSVHCLNRADGTEIWSFKTGRKVDASPVVCGDRAVVGSGDGRLYLLDLANGDEVWSYDIGRSIFSSPAVVEGVILVGANDGRLYAFGTPEEKR